MESIIKVFGIDWRLLAIQGVNFTIVLIILYFFLYKPVLAMLDERKKIIQDGLVDAEKAARSLRHAEKEKAEIVKIAHDEAVAVALRAKAYTDEKTANAIKTAEEKSQRIMEDAKKAGEELQRRLYRESEGEIAKTALLAAEKILRERV